MSPSRTRVRGFAIAPVASAHCPVPRPVRDGLRGLSAAGFLPRWYERIELGLMHGYSTAACTTPRRVNCSIQHSKLAMTHCVERQLKNKTCQALGCITKLRRRIIACQDAAVDGCQLPQVCVASTVEARRQKREMAAMVHTRVFQSVLTTFDQPLATRV
jgi:hypothetical protein